MTLGCRAIQSCVPPSLPILNGAPGSRSEIRNVTRSSRSTHPYLGGDGERLPPTSPSCTRDLQGTTTASPQLRDDAIKRPLEDGSSRSSDPGEALVVGELWIRPQNREARHPTTSRLRPSTPRARSSAGAGCARPRTCPAPCEYGG